MERKDFTFKTDDSEVHVQFSLAFDGIKPIISNIQIRSFPNLRLPFRPEIKSINGEMQFYEEYDSINSSNIHIQKYQYYDDNLSKILISKIYEIATDSTPRFEN